jgi:curved DNA-binding protein CbpA
MTGDPYRILGLPPGASAAEVKRAYRALAKANHPDSAGEKALPRFLAIQAAYEQLTHATVRPIGRTRTASRPTEAWRADSGRARDASAGGGRTGQERATGSSRQGSDPGRSRPGSTAGGGQARAAGGAAGSGAGPKSGGAAKGATGSRRRGTKKATFGSTTYDEVREPVDPTWQGASWYGQSSGEYWTVNPREYADPRKHGPEYQARAAARAARAAEREAEAARDAYATADASARADAGLRAEAANRAAAAARAEASRLEREAADRFRAEAAGSPPGGPPLDLTFGFDARRFENLPLRRGVLALAAWPPLGIAAASLIGEATGCAAFSASCTSAATFYPWIAQVAILAVLLLLPAVARVLAGGTIAVAILAFPVAAALSASGATYDRVHGPPSLIAVLAVVWVVGVVLMAARVRRSEPAA